MNFELYKPSMVQQVLAQYKLKAKKAFGQNFLVDQNILAKICSAAAFERDDFILEIGPGLGVLADLAADQVDRWLAVEIDRDFSDHLARLEAAHPNFEVIYGDFLKLSLADLVGLRSYKVVANLPYYITSPIITKIISSETNWQRMIFMVQLEVAKRLTAVPGTKDYGSLTLYLQYHGQVELVAKVSPNSFLPAPEVDSAVISIIRHPEPPVTVSDERLLFAIIQAAFQQRRKTLANCLKNAANLNYSAEQVDSALAIAGIAGQRRGETLSLSEFAQLSQAFARL